MKLELMLLHRLFLQLFVSPEGRNCWKDNCGSWHVVFRLFCSCLTLFNRDIALLSEAFRPHPNECSGGDLDVDLYFVSWDKKLIPPRTVPPMDYTASRPRVMDHDVILKEIQQFFVDNMISDSLGAISNSHLILADREPEKAPGPKCLRQASLHSMAIDFAKTGAPAEMPSVLKPREYPDFVERWDKPTYKSEGPLGKLYRTTLM